MSDVVKISFPDGAVKEFPRGTTTEDIAASISPGLKKKAIAGKWNGQHYDLRRPINEDGSIEIVVPDSNDALEILRHSTAHLMAQAVDAYILATCLRKRADPSSGSAQQVKAC
jgi:threonyl-tRNA synthetase